MEDEELPNRHLISYEDLQQGKFVSADYIRPIHETTLRRSIYRKYIFHRGVPIHYPGPNGFDHRELQRGFADFGKIHVVGRLKHGDRTLTIHRDPEGRPTVHEASEEVHEYAREAHGARLTFGDTAAAVAYGYDLDRAPYVTKVGFNVEPATPKWTDVQEAPPLKSNIGRREARELLNEQRFIRFSASDGRSILDVRLLPDGTKEREWLVNMRPIFHV